MATIASAKAAQVNKLGIKLCRQKKEGDRVPLLEFQKKRAFKGVEAEPLNKLLTDTLNKDP